MSGDGNASVTSAMGSNPSDAQKQSIVTWNSTQYDNLQWTNLLSSFDNTRPDSTLPLVPTAFMNSGGASVTVPRSTDDESSKKRKRNRVARERIRFDKDTSALIFKAPPTCSPKKEQESVDIDGVKFRYAKTDEPDEENGPYVRYVQRILAGEWEAKTYCVWGGWYHEMTKLVFRIRIYKTDGYKETHSPPKGKERTKHEVSWTISTTLPRQISKDIRVIIQEKMKSRMTWLGEDDIDWLSIAIEELFGAQLQAFLNGPKSESTVKYVFVPESLETME